MHIYLKYYYFIYSNSLEGVSSYNKQKTFVNIIILYFLYTPTPEGIFLMPFLVHRIIKKHFDQMRKFYLINIRNKRKSFIPYVANCTYVYVTSFYINLKVSPISFPSTKLLIN